MPAPIRFPWAPASAAAAAAVLAAAFLLRLPEAPPANRAAPRPTAPINILGVAGQSAARQDLLDLNDPTRLFLPGPEAREAVKFKPEVAAWADAFRLEFTYPEGRIDLGFSPGAEPAPDAGALLRLAGRADAPLAIGQLDDDRPPLPARLAGVVVTEAGTGRVVWRVDLPPATDAKATSWLQTGDSLEWRGTVGPAGLLGGVALQNSSGDPALDRYFRDRLEFDLHLGARLDPGVYLIRVEP
jgi:hypothetical protein